MWDWVSSLWDTAKGALTGDLGKTALTVGGGLLGNYLTSRSQADQSSNYASQQQQVYQDYVKQLKEYTDEQNKQQQANYEKYLKLLKPPQSEKNAMYASGAKKIRADASSSGKRLTENLASRGLGGGQTATGLADNARTMQSNLGDLRSQVELFGAGKSPGSMFQTTPYQAVMQPVTENLGTTDYFTSNLGNLLQYGSGVGLSSLLKNSNLFSGGGNNNYNTWVDSYFGWPSGSSASGGSNTNDWVKSYFGW